MLVREVRAVQAETPTAVPVPRGMTAELRPYQRDGFHWLAFLWRTRLGGILADDMGLGKTLQCLDAYRARARIGRAATVPCGGSDLRDEQLGGRGRTIRPGPAGAGAHRDGGERQSARRSIADDLAAADLVVTSYALFRLDFASYRAVAADPARGIAGSHPGRGAVREEFAGAAATNSPKSFRSRGSWR